MTAIVGAPGIVQTAPPTPAPKANDRQIGGEHYKRLKPEPWDVIVAWNLGYLDGNIVKYVTRYREKGGLVDLLKAQHYLEKLIEIEKGKTR
jgi:hypothetical protein